MIPHDYHRSSAQDGNSLREIQLQVLEGRKDTGHFLEGQKQKTKKQPRHHALKPHWWCRTRVCRFGAHLSVYAAIKCAYIPFFFDLTNQNSNKCSKNWQKVTPHRKRLCVDYQNTGSTKQLISRHRKQLIVCTLARSSHPLHFPQAAVHRHKFTQR